MTPPMTKYDLRSGGRVDQSSVDLEIGQDPRDRSTVPNRRGRPRKHGRRVQPYPTLPGGSIQAYSRSSLDSSPVIQSLPGLESCAIGPPSDSHPYSREGLRTEPCPWVEPHHSTTHTPQPAVIPYAIPGNEATPPEPHHNVTPQPAVNSYTMPQHEATPPEPHHSMTYAPQPAVNLYTMPLVEATPPEPTTSHVPFSSDQAPTAPYEDAFNWLDAGDGWGCYVNLNSPTTSLDNEKIFSSDSGVMTSAPCAMTISSSPLTDVTTCPKDFERPTESFSCSAMRIYAKVQAAQARDERYALKLQSRANEIAIEEMTAELHKP